MLAAVCICCQTTSQVVTAMMYVCLHTLPRVIDLRWSVGNDSQTI